MKREAFDQFRLSCKCLLIDLETTRNQSIHHIGALFGGQKFERSGRFDLTKALAISMPFLPGLTIFSVTTSSARTCQAIQCTTRYLTANVIVMLAVPV